MKKFLIPFILATLIGFCLAQFMFSQYDSKSPITPVLGKGKALYFIQQGVYSSKELMEKHVTDFPHYIYTEKDTMFYVYIGITGTNKNAEKLVSHFKKKGYTTIIKEISNKNESFITILDQYDGLLDQTNDTKTIDTICNQVLSKYEGSDLSGNNNQGTTNP